MTLDLSQPCSFLLSSGLVEFPKWPQCLARTRAGRCCRNEVVDTGQTGPYLRVRGHENVQAWEVSDYADNDAKLQAQLCRVHLTLDDVTLDTAYEGRYLRYTAGT